MNNVPFLLSFKDMAAWVGNLRDESACLLNRFANLRSTH